MVERVERTDALKAQIAEARGSTSASNSLAEGLYEGTCQFDAIAEARKKASRLNSVLGYPDKMTSWLVKTKERAALGLVGIGMFMVPPLLYQNPAFQDAYSIMLAILGGYINASTLRILEGHEAKKTMQHALQRLEMKVKAGKNIDDRDMDLMTVFVRSAKSVSPQEIRKNWVMGTIRANQIENSAAYAAVQSVSENVHNNPTEHIRLETAIGGLDQEEKPTKEEGRLRKRLRSAIESALNAKVALIAVQAQYNAAEFKSSEKYLNEKLKIKIADCAISVAVMLALTEVVNALLQERTTTSFLTVADDAALLIATLALSKLKEVVLKASELIQFQQYYPTSSGNADSLPNQNLLLPSKKANGAAQIEGKREHPLHRTNNQRR